MAQINPSTALPAARLAIGAGAYAFPDLTGKVFGLNMTGNHEAVFMGRLFAVRDIVLGLGALTSTGEARALWWRLGILTDAADAATGYLGLKAGGPKRGMIMSTIAAVSAVGMGVAAARSA